MWLFRIAVGTSLLDVLSDITIEEPGCTPTVPGELVGDCSPGIVAPIVVLVYAFLCRFLLIPLITATLVNTFFDTIDDMRSLVRHQASLLYKNHSIHGYVIAPPTRSTGRGVRHTNFPIFTINA
jgi:hypothetical protein